MPTRLLEPYLVMLPRLMAVDSLRWAERVSVGLRMAGDTAGIVRAWRREAGSGRAKRPRTPAELAVAARASGIGFRRVVAPRRTD